MNKLRTFVITFESPSPLDNIYYVGIATSKEKMQDICETLFKNYKVEKLINSFIYDKICNGVLWEVGEWGPDDSKS